MEKEQVGLSFGACTHSFIRQYRGNNEVGKHLRAKFDHIHYFNLFDTIEFQYDGETFKGMILDSGEEKQYFPQLYNYAPNVNLLGIYFGKSNTNELNDKILKINDKDIKATIDGSYSEDADTSGKNAWEFFLDLISKLFTFVGDGIQSLLDKSVDNEPLTYTRADLEANAELNQQIQVADAGVEVEGHKTINIKETARDRQGETEEIYNAETEIPVIPVDSYWLTVGDFDLFDINFFDVGNENENNFRNIVKNITLNCSRAVMYISAALLFTILIWRSIMLVKASWRENPEEAAESKKVLDSWIKGVALVGLIYFIVVIAVYSYSAIINLITQGDNQNYLMRVNVENVYSFNTNSIGFIKYLSLSTDVYEKLGYSILYLIMALFNLMCWLAMLLRLFLVAVFTIIAPITAINMAKGKSPEGAIENIFTFKGWLKWYLLCIFAPLVIILCQKLLIELL